MNRKTLILAQILITFMMAVLISGTMPLLIVVLTMEWLLAWPWQALTAWPIAFVFTQFTTPLAFAIAKRTIAK